MENKYSKILVAVDGSKQAEWAFKNAVAIAQRNEDAELYIASVIDATIATSGLSCSGYCFFDTALISKSTLCVFNFFIIILQILF